MSDGGRMATTPLGEVAHFVRGINFKPDDVVPLGTPGAVACMRTKNVQAELDQDDVWAVAAGFVKRDDQFLRAGDILVSSANSWNLVGKCCWIPALPWRASFGGFVSVLRGDTDKVDPRYLFQWFASSRVQITVRSFGQQTTNIANLNQERCLRLPVPLPSLAEQRRIAEVLDRAEALRAKRRAAHAHLDTLTQCIFLDVFGDPITNPKGWASPTLEEVIVQGPQNGLYKPASEYGAGTPILRIDAFYDGKVTDLAALKRVQLSPDEIAVFGLRNGDLVINRVNSLEYLGKSALIPELLESTVFESNMMRFSVNREAVEPRFVIEFLQTSCAKAQILSRAKNAVNQSSINQQDVKGIRLYAPPLKLQQAFVRQVAEVEKLKASHRASLADLDTLFASLQHRAFRGEL